MYARARYATLTILPVYVVVRITCARIIYTSITVIKLYTYRVVFIQAEVFTTDWHPVLLHSRIYVAYTFMLCTMLCVLH